MLALYALKMIEKRGFLGCQQPQTVAAVAASLAVFVTKEAKSLEEIAEASGCVKSTIKKMYFK